MARRGSGAWQVPGNPMAGVMRDAARRSRKTGRPRQPRGPQPSEQAASGPQNAPAAPARTKTPAPSWQAAVVATDTDGRATWAYPRTFPAGAPVVAATVRSADKDTSPVFAVLEDAGPDAVTVRVWHAQPGAGGGMVPAGPGLEVHLIATPRTPLP